MTHPAQIHVSNSAADRAGDVVRAYLAAARTGEDLTTQERIEAINAAGVIREYRRMHATPMTSVTMGIQSMVKTVRRSDEIRPGQRFKRLDRIIDKLSRYPRMRLSQMEDIGGCRIVLPTVEQVFAVLHRVRHNWPEANVSDYIAEPKSDGYRGIHIIKKRGGRLVEVPLRTEGQHEWAESIEQWGPRLHFNLKDGE